MRHPFRPTLTILSAALLVCAGAHAEAPYSFGSNPGKLPKNVMPLEYHAHLVPNTADSSFSGTETVDIEVLQPTNKIVLNAVNIDIDHASVKSKGKTLDLTVSIDEKQQTASFAVPTTLAKGHYQLALSFRGKINREARGFFALQYKDGDADKTMLTSTMEPSDARRLLPMWDEPAFRAKFKLSIDVPKSFHAYSNTPVEQDQPLADGKHRVSFATTPKMASYLLMLTAGELERNSVMQDGVEMGFITTHGKQDSTRFARDSAKDVLHYYNQYFGVKYPLSKLDHIAVPGSFNGAMENWGGIVYNETTLLWDAKNNAEQEKQTVFEVAAHEMAHQWFGDLVTMGWWDNLWLNEAFASWMAAKSVEQFHPEWRSGLKNMVDRDGAMGSDSRKSTHPIQTVIHDESEAANSFDEITYTKGAAVLGMLESWIGQAAFQKGIAAYMAKHQYGNTTGADLWAALEKASGKPVAQVASSWIAQAGVPVVKVEQQCQNGQRQVTFSQQRYFADGSAGDGTVWQIPLEYGVLGGKSNHVLLSQGKASVTMAGCDGTLVVDPASVGYYRVQYDAASYQALASHVSQLPDATRLKLVTDTWALVGSQRLPLSSYMNLVAQLRNEPRLAVWAAVLNPLSGLDRMAEGQAVRAPLRQYISSVLQPQLQSLGWDGKASDTDEQRELRQGVLEVLAHTGDPAVIAEARQRFAQYLKDPASVSPATLDVVVDIVGRYADEDSYNQLLGLTMKAQGSRERQRFGSAMLSALDKKLAARSLEIALRPDMPTELASMVVPMVAGNEHASEAWEFAVAHREALLKLQDALVANRFFPAIMRSSSDERDADRLEAYVKQNFDAGAQTEARRAAESIRVRAKRKAQLLPQLADALKANKG